SITVNVFVFQSTALPAKVVTESLSNPSDFVPKDSDSQVVTIGSLRIILNAAIPVQIIPIKTTSAPAIIAAMSVGPGFFLVTGTLAGNAGGRLPEMPDCKTESSSCQLGMPSHQTYSAPVNSPPFRRRRSSSSEKTPTFFPWLCR